MRNRFANILLRIFESNDRAVLLAGDIGNNLFTELKKVDGDRFINAGIAEANMISVASGLAASGYFPIVYSITPFVTTRVLEQIKLDLAYANRKALIVGTGSGLEYSSLGPTHHSLEDISIMKSLPGLRIFSPSVPSEIEVCVHEAMQFGGVSYLRLGKKGEPELSNDAGENEMIYQKSFRRDFGVNPLKVSTLGDVAILIAGPGSARIIKSSGLLSKESLNTSIYSIYRLWPLNINFVNYLHQKYKRVVTVDFAWGDGSLRQMLRSVGAGLEGFPDVVGLNLGHQFMEGCLDIDSAMKLANVPDNFLENMVRYDPHCP